MFLDIVIVDLWEATIRHCKPPCSIAWSGSCFRCVMNQFSFVQVITISNFTMHDSHTQSSSTILPGNSAVKAISVLLSKGVAESNIIFLNLISVSSAQYESIFNVKIMVFMFLFYWMSQAPQGLRVVCEKFPRIKIVTSEIDRSLNKDLNVIPGMGEFGDRYFGTAGSGAFIENQAEKKQWSMEAEKTTIDDAMVYGQWIFWLF